MSKFVLRKFARKFAKKFRKIVAVWAILSLVFGSCGSGGLGSFGVFGARRAEAGLFRTSLESLYNAGSTALLKLGNQSDAQWRVIRASSGYSLLSMRVFTSSAVVWTLANGSANTCVGILGDNLKSILGASTHLPDYNTEYSYNKDRLNLTSISSYDWWTTNKNARVIPSGNIVAFADLTPDENRVAYLRPAMNINTNNIYFFSSAKNAGQGVLSTSDSGTYTLTLKDTSKTVTLGGCALTLDANGTSTWKATTNLANATRISALTGSGDATAATGYMNMGTPGTDGGIILGKSGSKLKGTDTLYIVGEQINTGNYNYDIMTTNYATLSGLSYNDSGYLTAMTLGTTNEYTNASNAVTLKNGFKLTLGNTTYNQPFTIGGTSGSTLIADSSGSTISGAITVNAPLTVEGKLTLSNNVTGSGSVTVASDATFDMANGAKNTVTLGGTFTATGATLKMDLLLPSGEDAEADSITAGTISGTFNLSNLNIVCSGNTKAKKYTLQLLDGGGTITGGPITVDKKAEGADAHKKYKITASTTPGAIDIKMGGVTLRQIIQGKGHVDDYEDMFVSSTTLEEDYTLTAIQSGDDEYGYGVDTALGTFSTNSGARNNLTIDGAGKKIIANGFGGAVIPNDGTITFQNLTMQDFDTAVTVNSGGTANLDTVTFSNTTTSDVENNGTLNIDGTVTFNKGVTGNGTTNFNVNFNNGVNISQATVTIASGKTFTNNGTITATGTGTNEGFVNNGTVTNSSNKTITAKVTNNGSFTNNASAKIDGSVTNAASKTFTNKGSVTANVTNSGTFDHESGASVGGNITNSGTFNAKANSTISGTIKNTGTVNNYISLDSNNTVTDNATPTGTFNFKGTGTLINDATITQNTVTNEATVTNTGLITAQSLSNSGSLTSDVALLAINNGITNTGTLTLTASAAGTLEEIVSGDSGTLNFGDGTSTAKITASSTISQATVNINTNLNMQNTLTATTGITIASGKELTITAGNLKGGVTNGGTVKLGAGTLGNYNITGGALETTGDVTANVTNLATTAGITNDGTYTLTLNGASETLNDNVTGTGNLVWSVTNGTFASGKTMNQTTVTVSSGKLTNQGTITATDFTNNGTVNNNSTITANVTNSGTFTNSGAITGNIVNSGSFTANTGSTIGATNTIKNTGTFNSYISLASGNTVTDDATPTGTFNFKGVGVDLANNAAITQKTVTNEANLTNNAKITAAITNKGTFTSSAGNIGGAVTNKDGNVNGTVNLTGGADDAGKLGFAITGGTVNITGPVTAKASFIKGDTNEVESGMLTLTDDKLEAAISGAGTVKFTSGELAADVSTNTLEFAGTVKANASKIKGTTNKVTSGTLELAANSGTLAKDITNNATMTAKSGVTVNSTVTNTGTTTLESGASFGTNANAKVSGGDVILGSDVNFKKANLDGIANLTSNDAIYNFDANINNGDPTLDTISVTGKATGTLKLKAVNVTGGSTYEQWKIGTSKEVQYLFVNGGVPTADSTMTIGGNTTTATTEGYKYTFAQAKNEDTTDHIGYMSITKDNGYNLADIVQSKTVGNYNAGNIAAYALLTDYTETAALGTLTRPGSSARTFTIYGNSHKFAGGSNTGITINTDDTLNVYDVKEISGWENGKVFTNAGTLNFGNASETNALTLSNGISNTGSVTFDQNTTVAGELSGSGSYTNKKEMTVENAANLAMTGKDAGGKLVGLSNAGTVNLGDTTESTLGAKITGGTLKVVGKVKSVADYIAGGTNTVEDTGEGELTLTSGTLRNAITNSGKVTFVATVSQPLTISAKLDGAGSYVNNGTLKVANAANLAMTGTDADGNLVGLSNTGTVNLGGTTESTLGTKITGGTLKVVGKVKSVADYITGDTNTVEKTNTTGELTLTSGTLSKAITNSGKVTFASGETVTISAKLDGAGSYVNSGTLQVANAANLAMTGKDEGGILVGLSNAGTVNLGDTTESTLGTKITGGALNVIGKVKSVADYIAGGTNTVKDTGELTLTSGTLGSAIGNSGKVTFASGETVTISAKLDGAGSYINSGTLNVANAANLAMTGTDGLANNGALNVGGDTLSTLDAKITDASGTLNFQGTGGVEVTSDITQANVTNSATKLTNKGSITAAVSNTEEFVNDEGGNISGSIDNAGKFTAKAGSTLSATTTIKNTGEFNSYIGLGAENTVTDSETPQGTFNFLGNEELTNAANITQANVTNSATKLTNTGSIKAAVSNTKEFVNDEGGNISGSIDNAGKFTAKAGSTLSATTTIKNTSEFNSYIGLGAGNTVTDSETPQGTFNFLGNEELTNAANMTQKTVTNEANLKNSATIAATDLTNTGTLTNTGNITANVTNSGSTSEFNNNKEGSKVGTITGNVTNEGTFTNSASINGFVSNDGTFENVAGASIDGDVTNKSGKTFTNAGTIKLTTATTGFTNAGTATNTGTITGDISNSGTFNSNSGSISGKIANEGTFNSLISLTAANTVTGAGDFYFKGSGITNNATIDQKNVTVDAAASLTNAAAITATTITNAGAVTNNAMITASNLTNTGSLTSEIDNLVIFDGTTAKIVNDGTITLSGDEAEGDTATFKEIVVDSAGDGSAGTLKFVGDKDVIANAAITQNVVTVNTNLEMQADLATKAGTSLATGKTLTIVADNLKSSVNAAGTGKVTLRAGTLADGYTISGGAIETSGNLTANASDLASVNGITNAGSNELTLNDGVIQDNIAGGGKTKIVGTVTNDNDKTVTQSALTIDKAAGDLTSGVNNLMIGSDGKGTIINDGKLTLLATASTNTLQEAVKDSAGNGSEGTLVFGGSNKITAAQAINQKTVNVNTDLDMNNDLTAKEALTVATTKTLKIKADNVMSAVTENNGTVDLIKDTEKEVGLSTLSKNIVTTGTGSVIARSGVEVNATISGAGTTTLESGTEFGANGVITDGNVILNDDVKFMTANLAGLEGGAGIATLVSNNAKYNFTAGTVITDAWVEKIVVADATSGKLKLGNVKIDTEDNETPGSHVQVQYLTNPSSSTMEIVGSSLAVSSSGYMYEFSQAYDASQNILCGYMDIHKQNAYSLKDIIQDNPDEDDPSQYAGRAKTFGIVDDYHSDTDLGEIKHHEDPPVARELTIYGNGHGFYGDGHEFFEVTNPEDVLTLQNIKELSGWTGDVLKNSGTVILDGVTFTNTDEGHHDVVNNGRMDIIKTTVFDKGVTGNGTLNVQVDTNFNNTDLTQGNIVVANDTTIDGINNLKITKSTLEVGEDAKVDVTKNTEIAAGGKITGKKDKSTLNTETLTGKGDLTISGMIVNLTGADPAAVEGLVDGVLRIENTTLTGKGVNLTDIVAGGLAFAGDVKLQDIMLTSGKVGEVPAGDTTIDANGSVTGNGVDKTVLNTGTLGGSGNASLKDMIVNVYGAGGTFVGDLLLEDIVVVGNGVSNTKEVVNNLKIKGDVLVGDIAFESANGLSLEGGSNLIGNGENNALIHSKNLTASGDVNVSDITLQIDESGRIEGDLSLARVTMKGHTANKPIETTNNLNIADTLKLEDITLKTDGKTEIADGSIISGNGLETSILETNMLNNNGNMGLANMSMKVNDTGTIAGDVILNNAGLNGGTINIDGRLITSDLNNELSGDITLKGNYMVDGHTTITSGTFTPKGALIFNLDDDPELGIKKRKGYVFIDSDGAEPVNLKTLRGAKEPITLIQTHKKYDRLRKGETMTLISNVKNNSYLGKQRVKTSKGVKKFVYKVSIEPVLKKDTLASSVNEALLGSDVLGNGNKKETKYALMLGYLAQEATPQTKSFTQSKYALTSALNDAGDLISSSVMDNATPQDRGWETFAAMRGSNSRYDEVSSNVTLNMFSVAAGLSKVVFDNLTLGVFAEGGNGRYDTSHEFMDEDVASRVSSKGDINYFGGGLFAKITGKATETGQLHSEVSVRAGRINSKYNSTNFDPEIPSVNFDLGGAYLGAHAGFGYKWNMKSGNKIDTYVKYLWSRQCSTNRTVIDEETISLDGVNSHRARIGFRYFGKEDEHGFVFFGGLAYEHEFDGRAHGLFEEYALPEPEMKGGSGMAELGAKFQRANSPWKGEFTINGHAGSRNSFGVNLSMWYEFGKKKKQEKQEEQKQEAEQKQKKPQEAIDNNQ